MIVSVLEVLVVVSKQFSFNHYFDTDVFFCQVDVLAFLIILLPVSLRQLLSPLTSLVIRSFVAASFFPVKLLKLSYVAVAYRHSIRCRSDLSTTQPLSTGYSGESRVTISFHKIGVTASTLFIFKLLLLTSQKFQSSNFGTKEAWKN